MAHKKAGGTIQTGRDSRAKRRGVKRFGGERVSAGEVLVRQKGLKFRPGANAYLGKDWTIHAAIAGVVAFHRCKVTHFSAARTRATVVSVVPAS